MSMDINHTQIRLDTDHPFYSASVASYDMKSGIHIVYSWDFETEKTIINECEFFKVPLLNVHHRQKEQLMKQYPTTIVNNESLNTSMISVLFRHQLLKNIIFYSFAFFIRYDKLSRINDNCNVNDLLTSRAIELTSRIQFYIVNDLPLLSLTPKIQKVTDEVAGIINSGLLSTYPNTSIFNNAYSNSSDIQFLSIALTAHLESQMTTVIEIDEKKNCDNSPLFAFLSLFLLPSQKQLSSSKIRSNPIPGLFLQCVSPRSLLPIEILLKFNRPWTWIRVNKKQIFKSRDIETHKAAYNLYRDSVVLKPDIKDEEIKARTQRCKKKDECYEEIKGTEWTLLTIKLLLKIPNHMIRTIANQKLNELLQKAVSLINATDYYLSKIEGCFLQPNQVKEVCNSLNISEEEKELIIPLANIFDKQICNRLCTLREEVLKQMVVMV
ncbi:hypothetical protein TRFO_23064 [Tritrichomonas foetus]|uniref:Uncharacterized protein n=1 Tax=Tritrichomonas foetus TaxID=1144522 RepID=A0A1J4KBW8_9EUKA|nr:hypothetical protein TRFO_23064 [Tritrichomonas foetus]|eukprot:OHT08458.1 hypothetical protein TRFO_23064 [Tritrichomonas foetus]